MKYGQQVKSTILQILCYELFFLVVYSILGETQSVALAASFMIQIGFCCILPIVVGVFWCFFKNKNNLEVQFRKMQLERWKRLGMRLVPIIVFLCIGRILEQTDRGNWLSSQIQFPAEIIPYILCSFNVALLVSLFPLLYCLTEFMFVKSDSAI